LDIDIRRTDHILGDVRHEGCRHFADAGTRQQLGPTIDGQTQPDIAKKKIRRERIIGNASDNDGVVALGHLHLAMIFLIDRVVGIYGVVETNEQVISTMKNPTLGIHEQAFLDENVRKRHGWAGKKAKDTRHKNALQNDAQRSHDLSPPAQFGR
jgi:hypothetical protein